MGVESDTIRRAIDHFAETGDFLWELYAEDMVFVTRGELAGRTEYHGHDGYRRALAEFSESWTEIKPRVTDVTELAPDRFVTTLRFDLRGHSGVELEVDEYWAVWVRDGKFARIEQHGARDEALAAAR